MELHSIQQNRQLYLLWLGLPSCLCHVCNVFRHVCATNKELSRKQIEICKFYMHVDLHINTNFEIRVRVSWLKIRGTLS